MTITIMTSNASGGGAERVACNLAGYLSERHKVYLVTVGYTNTPYPLDPRVELRSLNGPAPVLPVRLWSSIYRRVRAVYRLGKHILCSHTEVYVVLLSGPLNVLLKLRMLLRVPVIFS